MSTGKQCESEETSDDEDVLEAFKEATDTQFLNESMFRSKDKTDDDTCEKVEIPKSLRHQDDIVDEFNEFGVTQHFKDFVAKQLYKTLDGCIDIVQPEDVSNAATKTTDTSFSEGIKLLSDSKLRITRVDESTDESFEHNKRRRKKLSKRLNDIQHNAKCEEVAVDPDWILSKTSTRVWTERTRGTVYKYKKLSNGTFTELSPTFNE